MYLTTTETARRLGISRRRVLQLIPYRLPATRPGRDWMIREEDLYLVAVRKPGRPKTRTAAPGGTAARDTNPA